MTEQLENRKIILIIEDEVVLNHAITLMLEKKGYRVISTMRAEDALEVLDSEHPDIFVTWLDILLPGMGGLDFLAKVRKDDKYKDMKVVVCSVVEEENTIDAARRLGVSDYLIKGDYGLGTLVGKVLSYA